MGNALVVQRTRLPQSQKGLRAAQYVRMSTDKQRYSIQNQATVIAAYAHSHDLTIVHTYRDEGESGLRIRNRAGLTQLIKDVSTGQADFDWILVYDVSRWGRFQNVDESAHYEFVCTQAGINVVYCAEQFDNDGSMLSSIVKNLKRVMAAEFSRELSVKIREGARLSASLGFKQGGPAGYGLRRELFDENMQSKGLLKKGERKYVNSDRVRFRRGPADEVETVNWIFQQYADEHKSATDIARELNQRGIPNEHLRPWKCSMVCRLLRNENYIGNFVYNRMSRYLGQKAVANPIHTWVRSEGAIEQMVDKGLFLRAQKLSKERRVDLTEDEMLARLRDTLKRRGRLSTSIINETVGLPSTDTYMAHFGTIRNAYKLIGYTTKRDCDWLDSSRVWTEARATISVAIAAAIKKTGQHVLADEAEDCLMVGSDVGISFRVARCFPGKKASHAPMWTLQRRKSLHPGWVVAIRLDVSNKTILDYLLLQTSSLAMLKVKFTEGRRERRKIRQFDTVELLIRSLVAGLRKIGAVAAKPLRDAASPIRVSSTKPAPLNKRPKPSRSKRKSPRARH